MLNGKRPDRRFLRDQSRSITLLMNDRSMRVSGDCSPEWAKSANTVGGTECPAHHFYERGNTKTNTTEATVAATKILKRATGTEARSAAPAPRTHTDTL